MNDFEDYFGGLTEEEYVKETEAHFEWLENNAIKNKCVIKEWNVLTNDEESYPNTFEYVLVEDDVGEKNIAYCDPDYDWYISNGERTIKLIGEVIKWIYLD